MPLDKPLTNAQLELIKMFGHNLNDTDLIALKRTLAKFFADRASNELDRLWAQNDWSDDTMDNWLRGEDSSE